MNYAQTLDFLLSAMPSFQDRGVDAYKPGLERIGAFCRHLGNPQRNFFTIHVAGTNGKGSVSHIIAAVLQQAGYRTGLFTSPHLHDLRERIRVDGELIPKQKVVNFVDKHHDKMLELGLSFFEMTAALAFDYFAQSDVEVAVIETGLGGRLDATNIILPLVSVVTNIGLEHTALLGDTLPKIAAEKAGIIKKSIPIVLGEANAAYNSVFEETASFNKTRVTYAEREFSCEEQAMHGDKQHFRFTRHRDGHIYDFDTDLLGIYQRHNLQTALTTLDLLHEQTPLTISRRAFIDGVGCVTRSTGLQGRWQQLGEQPRILCDTGHNAHGMAYVTEQLRDLLHNGEGKLICVLGFSNDKNIDSILAMLPREAHYLFTQAQSTRAFAAEELQRRATALGLDAEAVDTVAQAYAQAKALATSDDTIFVGGSNFVVGEIL
jgi:dihydrofolate synthase/folylpolyglutamate synthase